MSGFLKYHVVILAIIGFSCTPSKTNKKSEVSSTSDTLVYLENDSVKLTFSLLGGAFIDFRDKGSQVNPFAWKQDKNDRNDNHKNGIGLQGHFLGLGRWGKPTLGEEKLGMPFDGEPVYNWWKLEAQKSNKELYMNCEAPLDGFTIKREALLSQSDALFKVTETFTNEFSIGRAAIVMQNLVFSDPFFDISMILNTNATHGFNQAWVVPNPNLYEYTWPLAYVDTLKISTIDIQRFSNRFQYISSQIFSDSLAWFTAYNPKLKLILGYAWRTSDYPWVHIRNDINYGKPVVRGFSFGNTGLGDEYTFEERLTTTFHGVKSFEFIDAKSSLTKSWYCFMLKLPDGYEKTDHITIDMGQVFVKVATIKGPKEYKLSL